MSRYLLYTTLSLLLVAGVSILLFVGMAGCGTNEKNDSGSNDNDFQVGFSNFSADDYKKQFEEVGPPESEFGATEGPVRFLVGGVGITFDSPSIRLHALLPPLPNISQEGAGGGVFYWNSPTVSLNNVEVRLEDGTTYKNGDGLETAQANQVATAPPHPGRLPLDVPGDAERYINVHMPHRLTEDADLGLAFENIQTLAGDLVITMPIGLTEHQLSLDGENRIEHNGVEVSVRQGEDETYRFSFEEQDRVHALQAIDADGNPVGLHSASIASGDADWEVSWRQDQPDAVRVMIADSYTDRTVSYEVPANLDRVQIEPGDVGKDLPLSTNATLTVDTFKVEDGATEIEWSPSDLPVIELLGTVRDGDNTEVKSAGVTGPGNARIRAEVDDVNLYYRTEANRVSGW